MSFDKKQYEEYLDKVNEAESKLDIAQKELTDYASGYLDDHINLSLEERWAIFENVCNYLPVHHYILRFGNFLDDNSLVGYDALVHVENRNDLVDFVDIIESLEDEVHTYFDADAACYHKGVVERLIEEGCEILNIDSDEEFEERKQECAEAAINVAKDLFLKSKYRGYTYDW